MHTANGPQRQGGFCATGSDHREWDPAGAMIKVILGRGLFTLPSDTSHGRCGGGKGEQAGCAPGLSASPSSRGVVEQFTETISFLILSPCWTGRHSLKVVRVAILTSPSIEIHINGCKSFSGQCELYPPSKA